MNRNPGLPTDRVETWLFDLDNTLYPASCNLFDEIHERMASFIGELLSVDLEKAKAIRRKYFLEHGTTLSGLMINHGIEPDRFLAYVHDIDVTPVQPNPVLDAVLARLPGRKIIFTNADTRHAENVMTRLGVARHFEGIFDIADADYLPKPNPVVYDRILADYGIDPARAAMLDDMVANLKPAAALGMTTIWVRTHYDWSAGAAGESDHVDHITEDVTAWLEGVAPPAGTKGSPRA